VFIGARNEKAGRAAAQKIGAMATFLKIDVSDQKSIQGAAKELAKAVDRLDVLVNNAGIIVDGDDAILKATPEQFEETMRTNALGPLMAVRLFNRCWRSRRLRGLLMSQAAADNSSMERMVGRPFIAFRKRR
jgi:Short-chain alcohol dehydrogenase of unknown specificity